MDQEFMSLVRSTLGGRFVAIANHVTKEGEVKDRQLQIGVHYFNIIERDLATLRGLDPQELADCPDMVNPLVRQDKDEDGNRPAPVRMVPTADDVATALEAMIESKVKSLAKEHEKNSNLKTLLPGRILQNPANPDEVLLVGLQTHSSAAKSLLVDGKEVATEIKRKETVRNSIITGIKPWITYNFTVTRYWRHYALDLLTPNFTHVAMNGEVYEGARLAIALGR